MKLLSRAGSLSVSRACGHGVRVGEQFLSKVLRTGGAWFGAPGPWASVCPSDGLCGAKWAASWVGRALEAQVVLGARVLAPENLKRVGKGVESGGEASRGRNF